MYIHALEKIGCRRREVPDGFRVVEVDWPLVVAVPSCIAAKAMASRRKSKQMRSLTNGLPSRTNVCTRWDPIPAQLNAFADDQGLDDQVLLLGPGVQFQTPRGYTMDATAGEVSARKVGVQQSSASRLAPRRTASRRFASPRSASRRSAPPRFATLRFAPSRFAPRRSAS